MNNDERIENETAGAKRIQMKKGEGIRKDRVIAYFY